MDHGERVFNYDLSYPMGRRWNNEETPTPAGYDELARYKGHGRFTFTDEGQTDYTQYRDSLDYEKAYGMAGMAFPNFGGARTPPKIGFTRPPSSLGVSIDGLAAEISLQKKHFKNTLQSTRELRKQGAVHLFNDTNTYKQVEFQLFQRGSFTGITNQGSRNWARFGMRFDSPIGYRLDKAGNRIPLYYGQMKIDLNTNLYHIIPRTGP